MKDAPQAPATSLKSPKSPIARRLGLCWHLARLSANLSLSRLYRLTRDISPVREASLLREKSRDPHSISYLRSAVGEEHIESEENAALDESSSSSLHENPNAVLISESRSSRALVTGLPLPFTKPCSESKTMVLLLLLCLALPSAKDHARGQLDSKEWKCLDRLWYLESRWNPQAVSSTNDVGIPQRNMKKNSQAEREAFLQDPQKQVDWGLNYIKVRHGTPCRALAVWMSRADKRGVGGSY
jgi:hypothetical protein